MFGANEIIGEKAIKIDNKHRIIIPAFTGVEPNEELVLQLNMLENILFIYGKDEFYKKSKLFEQTLKEQSRRLGMSLPDLRKIQRLYYSKLSFMPEKVDREKRIIIPEKVISSLELTDRVFVIGKNHHIELCKNRDIYEQIISEEQKRRGK